MTDHSKIKNIASELMPTGKAARAILSRRAKKLNEIIQEKHSINKVNYIRFRIGHEHYGIPYPYIQKVLDTVNMTQVPYADDRIAGITNYHGTLLSVINLKHFFHFPTTDTAEKNYLIVCKINDISIGILSDRIEESCEYEKDEISRSPSDRFSMNPMYVLGIHEGTTTILDIEKIFKDLGVS